MDKRKSLFCFVLVLALIVTLVLGTMYRKNEGFVNTKSCLSLSQDQVISAYEMCNNLVASDPSNCQVMIGEIACPIKGVAMNAMFTNADAAKAVASSATDNYAPFG
jgi:hypothetical protein